MQEIIWGIVAACILISLPIIRYLQKCFLNYGLFKKVGWIITPFRERNLPDRCNTSLLDEIIYKQQDLEIPKEYWILRDTETEHAEEILKVFQEDISRLYFGGYLATHKKIRNLQEDWFFMYRLFVFSEEYAKYDNHKLREKIYKYESSDGSYHTHSLTDYGITFYKLYLISLLYVENNPYTRKLYQYIDPKLKEHLKTYLNTKNVTFWSYRP